MAGPGPDKDLGPRTPDPQGRRSDQELLVGQVSRPLTGIEPIQPLPPLPVVHGTSVVRVDERQIDDVRSLAEVGNSWHE